MKIVTFAQTSTRQFVAELSQYRDSTRPVELEVQSLHRQWEPHEFVNGVS